MSRYINVVTFICPVTLICDIHDVQRLLFVRHPCRVGVPWDVTVCRRLSCVFVFRYVGSFRVNILADTEFVFFVLGFF